MAESSEAARLVQVANSAVADPVLDRLDAVATAREEMFGTMGALSTRGRGGKPAKSDDDGYDVAVVKPRALDVRKLARLAGRALPPEIDAALGGNVPVLVYHGLTPFNKPGRSPEEVWGMGYEVSLRDVDADTLDLVPSTTFHTIGSVGQKVEIGLDVGGRLGVPQAATAALSMIPGVTLQGAQVTASTTQNFVLNLAIELNLLEVQAGPVGAGGARWNLYRQQNRLDRFQPLLQTINVPRGTRKIDMQVETWVRRRGMFFGLFGSHEWRQKPERFTVSLEGLEG